MCFLLPFLHSNFPWPSNPSKLVFLLCLSVSPLNRTEQLNRRPRARHVCVRRGRDRVGCYWGRVLLSGTEVMQEMGSSLYTSSVAGWLRILPGRLFVVVV